MKLEMIGSRLDKAILEEGDFEVIVPDGVKTINVNAFARCQELVRVVLPDSVETIGSWAFCHCTALEEVVLGAGLKSTGYSAFLGCTKLQQITLPEQLTTIESNTFAGCVSLQTISLPEGLEKIESGAFSGCTSLTDLSIPKNVMSIEENAFNRCSIPMIEKDGLQYIGGEHILCGAVDKNMEHLVVPENVTLIANRAFSEYKMLKEVVLGSHVKAICPDAFAKCTALKKVTFPQGMHEIGARSFEGCKKLKEIVTDAETLSRYAFENCTALERVTLNSGVKFIRDSVFQGCKKLSEITFPSTLVCLKQNVFKDCPLLKQLVFHEGLKEIDTNSFTESSGIEAVTLPASLTDLKVHYWWMPKEYALRYVEISGMVELDKRDEYDQSRAKSVWEMMRWMEKAGICLKDMPIESIPSAVKKRAVIGFAEAVMRGVTLDEAVAQSYEAYVKKNKNKLAEDAAAYPSMLRLLMKRQLLAADKIEMIMKDLGDNQELIAELTAYRDSTFSAADKAKSKAKAKAGDDARAQRLADADAGKGGLTFVSDIDFGRWIGSSDKKYFKDKGKMEQFIGQRGMKLGTTLNGKTDFLIIGNSVKKTTVKMEKAKKLGIPFITEAELLAKKDVWKEIDRSLSADGKTYTFDASAEFAHEMLTNGTIPETVETINLSVVAIDRGKTEGEAIPVELSKKIRFIDLKRTGIDYSAITQYIYTKIGRDTLEEYYALMGKEKYYEVLPKIFAHCCNPIHDEMEASEEALEGIRLTALGEEIVNMMRAFLIGGREYILTYADTAHPVSEKVLMVLMMSLAYRQAKKETKRGSVLVNAWELIGSKETALFALMNRTQLRAMLADFFPMVDGAEHTDKEVARVAAIKLCGVDAAKGMMATVRELERKESGFGLSQVRYDLMNGIRAMLGASEDRDVLMYLDKVKHLDWAVNARDGVKEEELRAELLASVDLGLDEESGLTLDYGARQIRVQLQTDLTFSFVDLSKNKTMRSLPKAAKTDDAEKAAAAQEQFKRVRELIKTISVIYLNKIKEMYYQGTSMKKSKWDEMFMSRQVSLRMAHGVLWGVFDSEDTLKTAFCVKGNKCFDVDGNEISIPKTALIGVVDLAQLDSIDRAAWRKYFSQDEIPQPVKQVWQPLCMISIKDVEKRYMGCHIGEGTLQGLGWDIYAEDGQDTGVHSEYISAEIDYWSRHGMIYGTGKVTEVKVRINHDIGSMTDHEKRWWNQSVQKLDYYLKPESKAQDAIRSGDVSQVREWVECGLISADNLTDMIDVSTAASQTAVTAYLLEISQQMRAEDEDDEWTL